MKRFLSVSSSILLSSVVLCAQDAPPPNVQRLLGELDVMKEKNSTAGQKQLNQVIQEVRAAAANAGAAMDLYSKAMFATSFEGRSGQQSRFQEWRNKEAEKLKSPVLRTAIQLHLQYLSLVLRAANGEKTEQLLPELISYTNEVVAAEQKPEVREALRKENLFYRRSVATGVFAQWFGVGTSVGNLKDWELVPSNIDSIYQKTILPELRKKKDPSAIRYWDSRLQRAEAEAKDSSLTFKMEEFNLVERPNLIWSRAQEVYKLGQPNHAINQMYSLIRDYPSHPSNASWITQLKALLSPPEPTPSAVPQAESATVPTAPVVPSPTVAP